MFTPEELRVVLDAHKLWALNKTGGKRAYLQGADLQGAHLRVAYLQGADLQGAYLQGADLQGAYLQGAHLQGAYLRGAYLQGAYLQGAKIEDDMAVTALVARATRIIESYEFFGFRTESHGLRIIAGCRNFSPDEYREHVKNNYLGTNKGRETLDIIEFIEGRANAHS